MTPIDEATPASMAAYYARRAGEYEQVYFKPERQADIRALEAMHARLEPGARVVFCDNRMVDDSNIPLSRRDEDGNTYQLRRLADGSTHEVLKNFAKRDEALAALGPRARDPRWTALTYYWLLDYTLA